MAKFYQHSVVTVVSGWYGEVEHRDQQNHVLYTSTWFFRDDDTELEYRVRSLGRGRWLVETETGWSRFMRTAQLERFFSRRPDYEKVYVTKA